MTKAAEMAKVSAKGGFNLFWGVAASSIISAVGIIIVARLLSPSEYGIVTIVLIAPNLFSIFQDLGISPAMIKYVAQYSSENKPANVKNIVVAGLIFEIVSGFAFSILTFLLSGFFATNIFHRPDIKPLIQIAAFTVLAGALLAPAQSAFTGKERMEQYSITIILQSTLKTVLVPILIIVGPRTFGAILGTTIAFLIAGLISILLLQKLYKTLQKPNEDRRTRAEIAENMKIMFKYGLPLSISSIIGGFLTQFYTILIAIYATDLVIGNYQVALNFSVLITFFSVPISTVLFPVFSKLDAQKENETFRSVFQFSVKYGALLTVPAAAAVMALSQPIVAVLFGQKYTYAPLFLVLIAVTYLFSALGSLSVGNVINGQGKTRFSLELAIIGTAIGLPLSVLLTSRFGVIGLLVTVIVAGIPSLIIGLWWIRKQFGATLEWVSSAKILLASAASGAIAYALISQLSFNSWIQLIAGAAVFLLAFLIITLITRTVNRTDTENLRQMLAELGPLRPLFNFILDIIERLMTFLRV